MAVNEKFPIDDAEALFLRVARDEPSVEVATTVTVWLVVVS